MNCIHLPRVSAILRLLNTEKITQLRRQRSWNQNDLAHAAGVTAAVISRLERGLQDDFKLSVVAAVASALGVSVDSLLVSRAEVIEPISLVPELASAVADLSHRPETIQVQAAGILKGYLSTLD